jgi:Fic family protein
VSEIHPFTDGNGRVSPLLMNQILAAAGLTRIIIPTVSREDYTLSLKALSNNAHAEPYVRMLTRAAQFSALLEYSSQPRLFKQLEVSNALKEHSEAKLRLKDLTHLE